MKKSELLKLLETVTDEQEVDELVKGSDIGKSLQSLDVFKDLIKNDKDFKSFIESENDKHHNKALDTWKKNNLEKELEPFIQTKYPDLIKDPIQKEILELKKQLEDERLSNARKDLLSQAMKYAGEKKMPTDFIDKFLDDDFDKTKENIDKLHSVWNSSVETCVEEKIKSSSYVPGAGGSPGGGSNDDSLGARLAKQSSTIKDNNYFGGGN